MTGPTEPHEPPGPYAANLSEPYPGYGQSDAYPGYAQPDAYPGYGQYGGQQYGGYPYGVAPMAPVDGGWGAGGARKPPIDGFAIAGFVTGIVMLFPLAFAFALVSIRRIVRGTRRGTGFAVAAFTLSGFGAVLVLLVSLGAAIDATAPRSDLGTITKHSRISPKDLRPGDCLELPLSGGLTKTVPAMPCADEHNAQVMLAVQAADSKYPGQQALVAQAEKDCVTQIQALVGTIPASLTIYVFVPQQLAWDGGYRAETCILIHPGGDITGDIRNVK